MIGWLISGLKEKIEVRSLFLQPQLYIPFITKFYKDVHVYSLWTIAAV